MVHPTCAHARPLDVPREDDSAGLARRANAELSAVREGSRAIGCLGDLLVREFNSSKSERLVSRIDAEALLNMVHAEFERRVKTSQATIESMQVPR